MSLTTNAVVSLPLRLLRLFRLASSRLLLRRNRNELLASMAAPASQGSWTAGMPLAAKGFTAYRYAKH